MNAFYREQKQLFIKAANQISAIEFIENSANQAKKDGVSENVIDTIWNEEKEKFETDFAFNATVIMQNFCNKMGFVLTKAPTLELQETN